MTHENETRRTTRPAYIRLPRDLAPPPGAWDHIAARLDPEENDALSPHLHLLAREIEPPIDVWPRIARRLAAQSRRRRGAFAALAAAAAIAAAVVLASIAMREGEPVTTEIASERPPAVAPDLPVTPSAPGSSLVAAWMLRMPEISSEVAATMRRELELVRDERLRIERAMEDEPDNATLHELWAHAYEVELQLADACGRTVMAYERG
jgi:hypothetical protein